MQDGKGFGGLGHVFKDELYFTKDSVDDSFDKKARPLPQPAPKGKHVFKMRLEVGKGFYRVPVNQNATEWYPSPPCQHQGLVPTPPPHPKGGDRHLAQKA